MKRALGFARKVLEARVTRDERPVQRERERVMACGMRPKSKHNIDFIARVLATKGHVKNRATYRQPWAWGLKGARKCRMWTAYMHRK